MMWRVYLGVRMEEEAKARKQMEQEAKKAR